MRSSALKRDYAFLDLSYARRLVRLYGTLARKILGIAKSYAELGHHFGDDLYEAEVRYQMDLEWAKTSDDVLWRRTKRGLHGAKHRRRGARCLHGRRGSADVAGGSPCLSCATCRSRSAPRRTSAMCR